MVKKIPIYGKSNTTSFIMVYPVKWAKERREEWMSERMRRREIGRA